MELKLLKSYSLRYDPLIIFAAKLLPKLMKFARPSNSYLPLLRLLIM